MPEPIEQALIEGWLEDAGLGHEPPTEGGTLEGFVWGLRTVGQPFSTVIAQRDVGRPHLFFQVGIRVADNHAQLLESLSEESLGRFMFDLQIALFQQPLGFNLTMAGENSMVPTGIILGYNMLEDQPHRAGFMRRLHQMQSGAQLTSTFFKKLAHLGDWP